MNTNNLKMPEDAPIKGDLKDILEGAISQLKSREIEWLRGFLKDISSSVSEINNELLVLFGTESGNAEALAEETQSKASALGIKAKIANMADMTMDSLKGAQNLLVIVSTWGDGEPPDDAAEFYELVMSKAAPKMDNKRFSVLALGDTSYEHFCKIGKDFDTRIEQLGGTRLYERKDCDVDFDDDFKEWSDGTLKVFQKIFSEQSTLIQTSTVKKKAPEVVKYSRKNPYTSKLSERINLNASNSSKETLHLEFDLAGSGLSYGVGDSLAVQPRNSECLVQLLLKTTGFKANSQVSLKEEECSLGEALKSKLDITTLSIPFLKRYNEIAKDSALEALLSNENKSEIQKYINGRDLVDVLKDFSSKNLDAQGLVGLLRKLPPRLYSIASSQKAHPDSVHLTVAAVRYETHGRLKEGVCSTYLADRIALEETADVFVTANKNFKLPEDPSTPIIMVGPGTGIAPFRAFMQERKATGAQGKNWIFFGDQHFLTDFLYQSEWQNYQKDGLLSKIDVAFSRDQADKIYVQHKMKENAKELFDWINAGAYFYVCGDASRMANDVDQALHSIIQEQASMNEAEASEYVKKMKAEKRYLRDVY